MELKILAKGAKREDIVKFLQESFARYDREDALAILEISMAANENIYRELKEDSDMVGAFERFNAEFLAKKEAEYEERFAQKYAQREAQTEERGRKEGRLEALRTMMEKLIAEGWSPERAAEFTGLSK